VRLALHKSAGKNHLPPNHPKRVVACVPSMTASQSLANWNLRQANILHHGPDDGQTAGFGREGVNLIGPLPHIAKQAFNGVGTPDGAVHHRRKGIQRQEMLFIFTEAAHRFGRALAIFGECSRPDSGAHLLSSLASRCQPVRWRLLAARAWEWHSSALGCLWTRQRCLGVAAKREAPAASSPSWPSVTMRSIWLTPRVRRSCKRQLQPSLSSSAHARKVRTSLLPSRSTPSAVTIMVASVLAP
jgi:hypothetical protein